MSKSNFLFYSISTAAFFAATPLLAQVSASDIWAEWQAQSALTGNQLTAQTVTEAADQLILDDVRSIANQDGAEGLFEIPQIVMTELPDGTVSIEMSETMTISSRFDDEMGKSSFSLSLSHENLVVAVSGPVEDRTYVYAADVLRLSDLEVIDFVGDIMDASGSAVMTDLAGTTRVLEGNFASSGTTGSILINVTAEAPDLQEGSFKLSMSVADLVSSSYGSYADMAMLSSPLGTMPEDLSFGMDLGYGIGRFDIAFEDDSDGFSTSASTMGGGFDLTLSDADGLSFSAYGTETRFDLTAQDLPVPISYATGSTRWELELPISATSEPGDLTLVLNVQDLTMGAEIWSMFDASQALPRDPISFTLDLSGQAMLFADLISLDFENLDAPPGELRALTLNNLNVMGLGAQLTGTGDVTFAPGQTIPEPVGQVDLQLIGLNSLLSNLTIAGLLPMQQVAMIQAMSQMFAVPSADEDTLTTVIDLQPGGAITANGIPLR